MKHIYKKYFTVFRILDVIFSITLLIAMCIGSNIALKVILVLLTTDVMLQHFVRFAEKELEVIEKELISQSCSEK